MKKRALGRGLSALLTDHNNPIEKATDTNADKVIGNIVDIKLSDIIVNPYQPRTHFDQQALEELADSIKELGVIQPITVRKHQNQYQLVSGERRFRASKLIGLKEIPAYVRLANDQEMLEMALVENIQRQDLDAIEVALSYQRLIDEINLTQNELSKRLGKGRTTITNFLRLLKLDPIIQTGIRDKMITAGHGRALINIENHDDQLDLYEIIIRKKLSVRQVEELIKSYKNSTNKTEVKPKEVSNTIRKATTHLSNKFDAPVKINLNDKGKGKIIFEIKSETEFERITKLLNQ